MSGRGCSFGGDTGEFSAGNGHMDLVQLRVFGVGTVVWCGWWGM
ncbi:hypothetical protein GCM10009779_71870 [Polymorphospora rubra]